MVSQYPIYIYICSGITYICSFIYVNVQEDLGENNPENRLTEPSQASNEIHVWTQVLEQKGNDRISKRREEMNNKVETILKEIRTNNSLSTTTIPRSERVGTQNPQPSGSKSK